MRHLDLSFQRLKEVHWDTCDTVMMTGMPIQAEEIVALTREAKRRGKVVVIGGPWAFHASTEAVAAGADMVVVGEAEGAMQRLINVSTTRTSVTYCPRRRKPTWPSRHRRAGICSTCTAYLSLPIQYCRGCPFHCEFCDATAIMGKAARAKTPQQILGELQRLYDLGWRGEVSFVDDNVIGNIERIKGLCRVIVR